MKGDQLRKHQQLVIRREYNNKDDNFGLDNHSMEEGLEKQE